MEAHDTSEATERRRPVPKALLVIAGVAYLVAAVIAYRDMRHILFDDVGITLRYAERIADGQGFTYNPGDRTNGASSPLYTLVLAFLSLLGVNLVAAAKAICAFSYAGTIAGLSFLSGRVAGSVAAVVAPLLLLLSLGFRTNALSGMESALACLLGVLTIIALAEQRYTWCGVLLGLCLFNKLDAGAIAIAIAVAMLVTTRRVPLRIVWVSAAVLAPWLLFSQFYFGSILPHSAATKVGELSEGREMDHAWMWNSVVVHGRLGWAVLIGVVGLILLAVQRRWWALGVTMTLAGWSLVHTLAFSFVNLGDSFPWYTTAMYPGIIGAAAIAIGVLAKDLWPERRFTLANAGAPVALVLIILAIVAPLKDSAGTTLDVIRAGHIEDDYEQFERTRMMTGWYVADHAKPGDVLETCFGWPAYFAKQQVIKETCPLSTRKEVDEPTWSSQVSFPGYIEPVAPEGWEVVYNVPGPPGTDSTPPGGNSWVLQRK